MPPEKVDWLDLDALGRRSLEEFLRVWTSMCSAAPTDIEQGYAGAREVVKPERHPAWTLANYLAQREKMLRDWEPQNGIEETLIDMLAQAHFAYCDWLGMLTHRTCWRARVLSEKELAWELPRQTEAEAIEQAAQMVDRFHRIFMRTLRQLKELRRQLPHVMIQNAGQVNLANQQVNLGVGS